MVERICPACSYGNPLDNRYCGQCGAPMEHRALPETSGAPTVTALAQLNTAITPEMKQVGKAVAISLAALAAEAGMLWLRKRVERMRHAPTAQLAAPAPRSGAITPAPQPNTIVESSHSGQGGMIVVRQRVTQVWQQGNLTHQTTERTVWRDD